MVKCDRCGNEVGEYITDAPKLNNDIKKVCYPCDDILKLYIYRKNLKEK